MCRTVASRKFIILYYVLINNQLINISLNQEHLLTIQNKNQQLVKIEKTALSKWLILIKDLKKLKKEIKTKFLSQK